MTEREKFEAWKKSYSANSIDGWTDFDVWQAALQSHSSDAEPVAYGILNTAITGKSHTLMLVRLEIPSDDQYSGALWKPLYLANPDQSVRIAELSKQVEMMRNKFIEIRESLQFASESVDCGITDTLWMMHKPQTIFDAFDEALELIKE